MLQTFLCRAADLRRLTRAAALAACLFTAGLASAVPADEYFQIKIVDEQTGRGVPLVQLKTVNNLRYWTDSAGVVAFFEPGLMNQEVFFHVQGHGYEMPPDGFGFRGRRVKTTPGGEVTWRVRRHNVAQRLYRVTGAGIYRDSELLGHKVPIEHPLLNAGVLGSDSVVSAVFRGRVYWFWGDTNRADYPLGNFHVPGATSALSGEGGLDIEQGVNLDYFTAKDGFAKETARMPGDGPTWIGGLTALRDERGKERMFAGYVKVRKQLEVYHRGLVEFDDAAKQFWHVSDFDMAAPLFPQGHPFNHREGDENYIYFAAPYALVRVPATAEALADTDRYQAYTCLVAGSRREEMRLDRDEAGRLRYAWRNNTPAVDQRAQQKLVAAGKARPEEMLLQLRDVDSGETVLAHSGSVYWNAYRRRWVMIVVQVFGSSVLGEVWYAEADTPVGPWVYARKVVTHEKYSFYNPKQHPMFDREEGRLIYFEGTYTHTFSGNDHPTPRYDYNQILYKLDLADPRLVLPVPIYAVDAGDSREARWLDGPTLRNRSEKAVEANPAFFALDRPHGASVAIYATGPAESGRLVVGGDDEEGNAADSLRFHALPADIESPPAETVPLYEFVSGEGVFVYSTSHRPPASGFRRSESPLCRVWRCPTSQRFTFQNEPPPSSQR
jgi:hypothetical protein